ncbi:hypothetical protein [Massilia yuzhufengensis]|uniref:Secreted protein n=1 Tax=Massilia yuzhufengensis TaxID=1164594 RepID=A0A1I1P5K7_9BURK|nr:hypothetical protein [Massilia yuzhufengensis]SFD05224.1 hypothetical protein SAMN05216204_11517 [Massilia yuzhufengensis]
MRRLLVILLVLLFPLNVFALSMSASLMQDGPVASTVDAATVQADSGSACALACDLDPDEPPGHQDLHDIVYVEGSLRPAGPPDRAALGHEARSRCHSLPPPVKPPRA